MPETRLERVRIEEPDPGYRQGTHEAAVAVEYGASAGLRGHWEGTLLAGVLQRLSRAAGLPKVVAFVFSDGGSMSIQHGRELAVEPPHERDRTILRELVRSAARSELEALEILEPYGFAPAVTLRVREPHSFLRHALNTYVAASTHFSTLWEGSYIEVRDDREEPVWRTGYSTRLSTGGGIARSDVQCCNPFFRHTLSGPPRPLCPVFEPR